VAQSAAAPSTLRLELILHPLIQNAEPQLERLNVMIVRCRAGGLIQAKRGSEGELRTQKKFPSDH
jgi:hypothetical protein